MSDILSLIIKMLIFKEIITCVDVLLFYPNKGIAGDIISGK